MDRHNPWVAISALNHFAYCPRRCALIHQEQVFEENRYTTEGRQVHRRVDEGLARDIGVPVETSVRIWSDKLRLTGIADVVEWHGSVPYPVEYKHGRRHQWVNDDVQLCAQALCLEEMLEMEVPAGAIYHAASRHRREVIFTSEIRDVTRNIVGKTRQLLASGKIPAPTSHRERCPHCSLIDICLPDAYGRAELPWLTD